MDCKRTEPHRASAVAALGYLGCEGGGRKRRRGDAGLVASQHMFTG